MYLRFWNIIFFLVILIKIGVLEPMNSVQMYASYEDTKLCTYIHVFVKISYEDTRLCTYIHVFLRITSVNMSFVH